VGDDPAGGAAGDRGLRGDAQARKVAPTRFVILFVVILAVLFAAELTPPVQNAVVLPWTEALARISASLATLFDSQVAAYGKILQSRANGFSVSIEAGCNGIEAAIILIAAMLAFPAPAKHRAIGIVAGLAAVQALNVVRVISLFYLGQWNMKAFEWAHLYLWQALIMLDVLIVWLVWIRTLPPRPSPRHAVAS
jgi:exosortase H (IPTLxxWG-CTERM-specific)